MLILVLGILGLVFCPICGIVAWVLGNNDLAQMQAGSMDPAGEGLTIAGRICGIIAVAILVLGVVMGILGLIFGFLGAWQMGMSGRALPLSVGALMLLR